MYGGLKTEHSPVRKFQSLPDALGKEFLELSKLAYEGFEKEEVIFYSDIGEHFGFLDAVPDLYGGCDVSFNFLHLTLQEFFAAYHISHMPDSGVELFKMNGNDKRWNVVWRFVAGLTEFKFLNSFSLAAFSKQEVELSTFFIQCLFEAQCVKIDFQSTFGHDAMVCKIDIQNTSLDCYALGYCISHCTTTESSWNVSFQSKYMCSLDQGLMSNKFSIGNSAERSPSGRITDFSVNGTDPLKFNGEEKIHLFQLVSHMPHLRTLDISDCNFGHPCLASKDTDGLLKLLQYLPHSKVASLDIRRTQLEYFLENSQDYRTAIQSLVSPSSNLKTLKIESSYGSHRDGYQTMIRSASSDSSLTRFFLEVDNDLSLLNALQTNNHLIHLEIICIDRPMNLPELVPHVARILQHNKTLKTLVLKMLSYVDSNILTDITTALQRNENIRRLHLYASRVDTELKRTLQAIDSRVVLYTIN